MIIAEQLSKEGCIGYFYEMVMPQIIFHMSKPGYVLHF